ncbi:hypothetical protein CAXC1_80016 [Candidatus Xenohaliotis californiensis]|uniref:histidine kinase n=1 Tax=Candidatus Xenohaliotis californiensis TaxID=84677 RepID=A0ABP0EU71_9RICK|nr:hypothetical protein CAXC1_80016 [Candidatus Xenohaliotis californiensis]
MKNKEHVRQYSVLNDFIKMSFLVVLLTIAGLVIAVIQKHRLFNQRVQRYLHKESIKMVGTIRQSISHIEYIMSYIVNRIQDNNGNIEYVDNLINSFHKYDSLVVWDSINWLDNNGVVKAGDVVGKIGTIHPTISGLNADNLNIKSNMVVMAYHSETGLSLEQNICSLLVFAHNDNGDYLGTLAVDIKIDDMLLFIKSVAKLSKVHFAVDSGHNNNALDYLPISQHIFLSKLKPEDFVVQNVVNYPLKILAVYDPFIRKRELYRHLFQTIFIFTAVCSTMVIFLYIIHIRNIKPIVTLARVVDLISMGKHDINIPNYKVAEISILAQQLRSINCYISELELVRNELSRKKIEAEIANKAKSEFMARISHELKTPLNVIIAFSEIMKNQLMGQLNDKYTEYSNDIYESGRKLLSTIDDILHISTTEVGVMHNKGELVNVVDIIQKVINDFRKDIKRKSLQISIAQDAKVAESYVNSMLTERVIWHIISNSIKFSHNNGCIDITILTGVSRERLIIIIKDEGIGIANDKLNIAYSAFDQLDGGLKRRFEGIGLGLSLAKKILNLQNGSLDIISKPNEGTMVSIKIPATATVSTDLKHTVSSKSSSVL